MKRIESFYHQKPTLLELLEADPTVLNWGEGLLPENIDSTILNNLIIRECGDFQTLAKDAPAFKVMFAAFAGSRVAGWTLQAAALVEEYDPLHNYDRTDEESESIEASGSSSSSGSSEDSGSDNVTRDRQGFNSDGYVGVTKDTTTYGRKTDNSSEAETSGTSGRERTLHSVGNIGVTTSQQMLESELRLRQLWNIYEIILRDFRSDLCVEVW